MPSFVPVFAVRYGEIMYAGKTGHAHSLIVDHRDGWATFYSDLEHMFATPTVRSRRTAWVRAGEVLGYVGAPAPGAMKCLRFELWKRDDQARFNAVDPIRYMRSWSVLPWTDERLTLGGRS
jgi:murein DD-endopeptidase MepM/ murein hydrolase activator NlpD